MKLLWMDKDFVIEEVEVVDNYPTLFELYQYIKTQSRQKSRGKPLPHDLVDLFNIPVDQVSSHVLFNEDFGFEDSFFEILVSADSGQTVLCLREADNWSLQQCKDFIRQKAGYVL